MRYFQTFILPEKMVSKLGLSNAAANFSRNLIGGGAFDKVLSLMPVNVSGELGEVDERGYEVVYSKLRRNRRLSKLAIFAEQWKIFKRIRKKESIWFYNLNIINAFLFLLLMCFKPSVKRCVIVLDFTPAKSIKNQNYWYLKLINSADGIISLSPSDLFTVKNKVMLPGVVPNDGVLWPKVKDYKKEFLISGALNDTIAMLPTLLEVFSQMPDLTLHITGKAPDPELVKTYTDKFNNIKYHGMVDYDEYLRILHETPFLLSTRNPEAPENKCNFPSKIIEALLHNRIIISTVSYPQLDDIKYFEVGAGIKSFAEAIRNIVDMHNEEFLKYANQSDKVRQKFNTGVWNNIMQHIENKIGQ